MTRDTLDSTRDWASCCEFRENRAALSPLIVFGQAIMDFRAFYDQHVATVWRALVRLGVARTDLPDTVQEVFLVAFRKLPEFEGRSKLSTWLVGICYRVASDRRRLAHVRREIGDSGAVLAARDIGPRPDETVERSEGARMLDEILSSLRPEQREVFVMFELEEMSGKEIAALVGAPLKTVFSRLRLAREAFAAALSQRQRQGADSGFRATALAGKGQTP
jgi:RNA polymerase sigma-70 factor, ECF subfamily